MSTLLPSPHFLVPTPSQSRTPFLVSTGKRIKSFMLQQAGGKLLPPSPGPNGLDANGLPIDYDCLSRLFESQLLTANLCSAMGMPTELDPGISYYYLYCYYYYYYCFY
ncbi:unnamed protein product [Schistocephalus solidus]|uniref:Uncharacterized protein n=1 Tax=Schistocephalus solidus TaxID=70667 RepID=A0A183TD91_SCHSO|nr:unnamed protein product [Schistocephalus solidus]